MKLFWAKVKPNAKIPNKRNEDAGYDLYPCFEEEFISIDPFQTVMIPLGVASAFEEGYVMLLKERGSTGTRGIAQRAGVVDSGYRGEYMCPITNLNSKTLIIARSKDIRQANPALLENFIVYPYEKAICQGVLVKAPNFETEEISYEELMQIESDRMTGRLGSSGK